MVRRLEIHGKPVYTCEVCGFLYLDRAWAEKCQEHCTAYGSCSAEITRYAIHSVELLTA